MILEKGEMIFCLADVCKALGLANPSVVKTRLDGGYLISSEVSTKSKKQFGEFSRTVTLYCDAVLLSDDCMTMTQVAKELGMTCHDLTHYLLDNRVIYAQSGQYMLYADYARMGYAKNRTHGYRNSKDEMRTHSYLVWTERGRRFIHEFMNSWKLKN